MNARFWAAMFWFAMLAVFGSVGWFLAVEPVAVAVGNWRLTQDYVATPATVVANRGRDSNGEYTWYSARYEVAGRSFDTARLSVLDNEKIDERFNAKVGERMRVAHANQQAIEVFVSPRKPEVAIVDRSLPLGSLWAIALVGASFAVFALAGLIGLLGALLKLSIYQKWHDVIALWGFAGAWSLFSHTMFALFASGSGDVGAMFGVGFFVLVGLLMQWLAVHLSLFGTKNNVAASRIERSRSASKRSATNAKRNTDAKVERGGLGGRGDDFDKD
jgi:hypothetical protein